MNRPSTLSNRLNDAFVKFLFGREEGKHLFTSLINSVIEPETERDMITGIRYCKT